METSKADLNFFHDNGFLIIRNCFSSKEINLAISSFDCMKLNFATECGISYEDYDEEICQYRDIWKYENFYNNLIFDSPLPKIAASLMGETAARLLHDHIIAKPHGKSDEIPWHQDYPYWPVDNPNGLSLWLAMDDLDEQSGVLEVIPGSHKRGEEAPVDFISSPRVDLDNDEKIYLPVNRGDVGLLHSLTWHRTSPNTSVPMRRAHISLWIPPQSRYEPLHAGWHPVNFNITVEPGELMNEDWFPIVGAFSREKLLQTSPHPLKFHGPEIEDDDFNMFTASKKVKIFLNEKIAELGIDIGDVSIMNYLVSTDNRHYLSRRLLELNIANGTFEEVDACLKSLAINTVAFTRHRARNVYNHSYLKFIQLFLK